MVKSEGQGVSASARVTLETGQFLLWGAVCCRMFGSIPDAPVASSTPSLVTTQDLSRRCQPSPVENHYDGKETELFSGYFFLCCCVVFWPSSHRKPL